VDSALQLVNLVVPLGAQVGRGSFTANTPSAVHEELLVALFIPFFLSFVRVSISSGFCGGSTAGIGLCFFLQVAVDRIPCLGVGVGVQSLGPFEVPDIRLEDVSLLKGVKTMFRIFTNHCVC
jgi:hypothetical protein